MSGFDFDTSQSARSSRLARPPPVSTLPRNAGIAGVTTAPESSIQFPRARMRVSLGVVASDTITRVMEVSSSASSFSILATSATSAWASGEAHPKYAASGAVCRVVRISGSMRSALSTAGGISLPFSAVGQEYSPDESARRNRPMVARRNSESWCSRTVIAEPASVRTGRAKRSARNTFAVSLYVATAQPVFGSPSNAAFGGCSGAGLFRFDVPTTNGALPPSASASTSVMTRRSAPRATRIPGRLSSCTISIPSAVHTPAPGRNVTV